jgi:nucleoside-diphosphate-sugar epimerase
VRVLITGAAGFLGRNYVRYHLAKGDEVIGIDNLSNSHSYWPDELPEDKRYEEDAEVDIEEDFVPTDGLDLAYHFAAPVGGREKIEGDPLFNADSLRLDSSFFRWAVKNVKTVVYPSSSAVYGVTFQGKTGQALQEGMFHPSNPNWFAPDEMYGFTKLAGEVLAWKSAAYGLNVLCIRPFSGYGEDQSLEYPVPSIAARVARREDPLTIWGSGLQTRDFIHVSDLVGATISRLDAGVHGYESMNIGSGRATSFIDVAKALAKIAGYEPTIVTDVTKPEGVQNRWADTARMWRYYQPKVSLTDGLTRVLRAQEENLVVQEA